MFWTSRKVIARRLWAGADPAIASDAPTTTTYARQERRDEWLRTGGRARGEGTAKDYVATVGLVDRLDTAAGSAVLVRRPAVGDRLDQALV
jgi:hypothetical protein